MLVLLLRHVDEKPKANHQREPYKFSNKNCQNKNQRQIIRNISWLVLVATRDFLIKTYA